MDLNHEFTVNVPVAEAWVILTDLERIAPCLPGAQLTEIEGDTYRGQVKIKVGPILAQFKGQASFVSRDDVAHKATLKGEGRDTTGKGNASAMITAELTSVTPTSTKCTVHTDLSISGKVAQFEAEGGQPARLARYTRNYQTLITGMKKLGFQPFLDPAIQAPIIVTFHAPADSRYDFKTFYAAARARGFILYPGKLTQIETFRVGCIGAIGPDEMEQAVHAMGLALQDMGIASAAPA